MENDVSEREDPVLVSSRREAVFVLIVWAVAMTYTVTVSYYYGYGRSIESLTYVLGFPDWVFWGVVIPWLACVAISIWFGYFFMRDDDLGEEVDALTVDDEDILRGRS